MTNQPIDPPDTACAGGVPAELATMRQHIQELAHTMWAARDRGEVMDTVVEIESLKSTLDALELGVVGELEATGAVKDLGWASTADFLTAVAGGHKGCGQAMVKLATAVAEPLLAPVGTAMSDGWLSTAKAQVIRHAIDDLPGNVKVRKRGVEVMLTEAKALDATELRKVARYLVSRIDPDGDERRAKRELDREERAAHLGRELSIRFDGAGGARISGRCASEDAATLKATLLPLSKPVPTNGPTNGPTHGPVRDPDSCVVPGCGHEGRDPRDHGARMLDALLELCDRATTAELLPESHGTTPRVAVTIDLTDLKNQSGFGSTETGEDLTATTIRRMCCDADLIPIVLGTQGEVLDVGRRQRLVTTAIWKALVARDHHCRFPNCTRPPVMTHAHHIRHWAEGGATSLGNMILLCGHHHRLVHAGPWQIRGTGPNDFTFDPPPDTRRRSGTGREPPGG